MLLKLIRTESFTLGTRQTVSDRKRRNEKDRTSKRERQREKQAKEHELIVAKVIRFFPIGMKFVRVIVAHQFIAQIKRNIETK